MTIQQIKPMSRFLLTVPLLLAAQTSYAIIPSEAAGAVLNTPDELRSSTLILTTSISNQVGSVFVPKGVSRSATVNLYKPNSMTGLSAGDAEKFPYRPGVWINYSHSHIENDEDAINSDTDVDIFMIGIDTKVTENVLIGAVLSYEDIDSTQKPDATVFSYAAGTTMKSNVDKSGMTMTFYMGYKFTDTFNMDASFGFASDLDIDQDTLTTGPAIVDTYDTASSTNSRETLTVNLNKYWMGDGFVAEGHIGYFYANEEQEQYAVSNGTFQLTDDTSLNQLNLRGRYTMLLDNFEPYLGLAIEYDINSADENLDAANASIIPSEQLDTDDTGYVVALGFDYYFQNNSSLNLEVSSVESRDNIDNVTAQVSYRYNF